MALAQRRWASELLHFWFRHLAEKDWFARSDRVDCALQRRFEPELLALSACSARSFVQDQGTARAAILLFDQLPRNLYRGTADAFVFDMVARGIARRALKAGFARGLPDRERQFLYLPFMHSEAIRDQQVSLRLYRDMPHNFAFARSHYRMIARFGRFPHRNQALGRDSTLAEKRAIAAGNSW